MGDKEKSREGEDTKFNKALTCMADDRTACMAVERREAVTKARSDRMSLLAYKKNKIDMEIMRLYLAGMSAMQQEYFQSL